MERICPLLVLASDRRAVVDGFDPEHRCSSRTPAPVLDRAQQVQVCLSEAYVACPHFLQNSPIVSGDPGATAPATDSGLPSTRLVIQPESSWRRARPVRGQRTWQAVAAALLLLGVGGVAVASGAVSGVARLVGESMASSMAPADRSGQPSVTLGATPTPTLTPTSGVVVTATPLPTIISSPSAIPSAAVAPPSPAARRYVVQLGDSLSRIAVQFGTSVAALQRANGITDPNLIEPGQVLVIP